MADFSLTQTREQRYAAAVYNQVKTCSDETKNDSDKRDKYKSIVLSLPALIRTAGLAQALAFVASRSDDIQKRLVSDIAHVVLGEQATADQLLARSRGENNALLTDYMYLTHQVLDALFWYRRYTQALLEDKTKKKVPKAQLPEVER